MNSGAAARDLIVLTADKSMKLGVEALLTRTKDLGIGAVSVDVIAHPKNDPGVLGDGHNFIRSQCKRYRYAIAMCDREGCGREALPRERLEEKIDRQLRANGWEDRSAAVVIDPELENWIWGDWDLLRRSIGWNGDAANLREWLIHEQFLYVDQMKPGRPKEALRAAMKHVRMPFTSAIHQMMGSHAGFDRCTDPAFSKLQSILRKWFSLR